MGSGEMANLVLGEIQVDRIVEMILPFETLSNFFPDSSQEQIDLCKQWLEPWALCPETGKFILVVQSYLVRTPRKRRQYYHLSWCPDLLDHYTWY